MDTLVNYHVIDPGNIGDSLSAPSAYFSFPGYRVEAADIRAVQADQIDNKYIIVGGGGLLYSRFLDNFLKLREAGNVKKLIAWGIGQQNYSLSTIKDVRSFNYSEYLDGFDLMGIRDSDSPYSWVPCASCLHPSLDKKREIEHELVIFSHKKFQLNMPRIPRLTNASSSFDEVLDFLGSGETILTSSYHGAYWGTLLGRKVLAFPFSSKFYTLKHQPAIYGVEKWRQEKITFSLFKKRLYEFRYKNKFSCSTEGWQEALKDCRSYPEALQECRDRNQWYYERVLDLLN
ncbi:hypothetical protein [Oscillatoria sp. FACHB-1406]|uniref:hypothetical protein n=1 Tax=Oscillatoria sp. FACHB-1406 TaxID=2692846 RepID=UPI001686BC9F|nr:hypothetical protein [Oscillatoria sp. FACHB-1406]MBD2577470.1 hypothetical protein [Oscillatoria sp. FACHB-1406]